MRLFFCFFFLLIAFLWILLWILSSIVAGKRCHRNKEDTQEEKASADTDERNGNWGSDSFDGIDKDKAINQKENRHTKDEGKNRYEDGAGFLRHLCDTEDRLQNEC